MRKRKKRRGRRRWRRTMQRRIKERGIVAQEKWMEQDVEKDEK